MSKENIQPEIQTVSVYKVWDLPTRLFHWINLLLVFILLALGFVMMYKPELGISGVDAKIGIKRIHIFVGYAFAINLGLRIIWGCIGGGYSRLSELLKNLFSFKAIKDYQEKINAGKNPQYLGHNPVGKLMVAAMMLLFLSQTITGLIRAGTDIYYPPFGGAIQEYIAAEGVNPESILPYDNTGVNLERQAEIKPFKSILGRIHSYGAWTLLILIALHIAGAIYTENKHQGGVISAMFSGKKPLTSKPEDENENE